jgi:uncharacterized protein YigA (DUF484 family)
MSDHDIKAHGTEIEGRHVKVITEDDVVAYLAAHPDFLLDHSELMDVLTPPRRKSPDGIVDMTQVMMSRLRGEIGRLRAEQSELIEASRQNELTRDRIHASVLGIVSAQSFEKLIHVVTHEFPALLDVDVVTLAIEATEDAPTRPPVRGVYVLPPGAIDAALGVGQMSRLRSETQGEAAFFGPAARHVQSDVVVRLCVSSGSPDGVICFGSRDPLMFGPEQSTELLFFLTKVLENTVRAWLDLPE